MKKRVIIILMVCITQYAIAQKVTIDEARHVAKNFMYEKANLLQTKSLTSGEIEYQEDDQTYYYIFNFKDIKGFVIISGNKKAFPILGYSLQNHSNIGNHSPAFKNWMQMYVSQIKSVEYLKATQDKEVADQWNKYLADFSDFTYLKTSKALVEPLFGPDGNSNSISYNQEGYYNDDCPGGSIVGCVATAMSQIMVYYKHPHVGFGYREYNHSIEFGYKNNFGILSADFNATNYNIDSLPPNINIENVSVAQLCYHAGISVLMNYSLTGSSANAKDAAHALITNWDYDKKLEYKYNKFHTATDEWEEMLRDNLDEGMPLLYRGEDSYEDGGHTWICDGYDDSNNSFHMNWGWGGSDNGFFLLSALNPDIYEYNDNQSAVFGIKPNTSALNTILWENFETDGNYFYISPGWNVDGDGDLNEYGGYSNGNNGSVAKIGNGGKIDQWLISPKIGFPADHSIDFSFYSQKTNNYNQGIEVYISTTGTDINTDFSLITSYTITDIWTKYTFNLSAYAGQKVYLGIKGTGDESGGYSYISIDDMIITATSDELPTVITQIVSSISLTDAKGNGYITDLGYPLPYAHGVCWTISGIPTIFDFKTDEGEVSSVGVFSSIITNLSPNTTYYVRAYATNNTGTSYGEIQSFTTNACELNVTAHVDNHITCYGGNDGAVTAYATGGTLPYSYTWSNLAITESITELSENKYYITVTDDIGCSDIDSVYIYQPDEIIRTDTVNVLSGENYTYPDGITDTNITANTSHKSILTSVNSCDSSIITDIIIYKIYSITENIEICSGDDYTFPDGTTETNITDNTSHQSILASMQGYDSIVTTNINVHTINIYVSVNDNMLVANIIEGASYQWIDCDINFSEINGADNNYYIPNETGNYAVEVTQGFCNKISSCYSITINGIENIENTIHPVTDVSVWPNPTPGEISISLGKYDGTVDIYIYDIVGRFIMYDKPAITNNKFKIKVPGESGVYFIRLTSYPIDVESKTTILKVIKK